MTKIIETTQTRLNSTAMAIHKVYSLAHESNRVYLYTEDNSHVVKYTVFCDYTGRVEGIMYHEEYTTISIVKEN